MAKRKGMKFRTTQEKKTKQLRLFVLGFVGFLLAFALVSVAYMFKSHHLSMNDLFPEKEVESSDGSTDEAIAPLGGKATFMFACVSDDKDELYFVAAVNADLDSGEVRVCAFDPNTSADVSGNKDSLKGHYKTGGSKELKKAIDSLCGFTADKYAVSTANQFKNAINVLSGAQISVPERISYKTKELSLSLMPGNQTVKGETLLKYFRYCLTPSGGGAQKQGELLCVLFSQYINKTYLASGRNYFSQIIDSLRDGGGRYKIYIRFFRRRADRYTRQARKITVYKTRGRSFGKKASVSCGASAGADAHIHRMLGENGEQYTFIRTSVCVRRLQALLRRA